ncbi:MAG TPA: hypothetical protein VF954_02350, partial [Acidimicrobiales bacterium]
MQLERRGRLERVRPGRSLVAALAVAAALLGSAGAAMAATSGASDESAFLAATNSARAGHGLAWLASAGDLVALARQ